jgi:ubiquinone/menaquinone biosynthesis C-methylase UbiE
VLSLANVRSWRADMAESVAGGVAQGDSIFDVGSGRGGRLPRAQTR